MPSIYRVLKSAWQILPPAVRSNRLIASCAASLSRRTISAASHQEIYDADYYRFLDSEAKNAAMIMAGSIVNEFHPKTLVDVGCGTGALLEEIRGRGIRVVGLEYSDAGLEYCRSRALDVHRFDLTSDLPIPVPRCDVCTSFEVAEHLPEKLADQFIQVLSSLGDVVILTAATPGQGGAGHINEQPHEYWIQKATAHALAFDAQISEQWRRAWKEASLPFWYSNNVMIFRRKLT